jgi:hypothetical protein
LGAETGKFQIPGQSWAKKFIRAISKEKSWARRHACHTAVVGSIE